MAEVDQERVLVLGSTGRVGSQVVSHLICMAKEEAGRPVEVLAATRDTQSEAAQRLRAMGAKVVEADMKGDAVGLLAACRGAGRVFVAMPQSFTPQEMLDCQAHLAEVFRECRPSLVVKLSSFGIDAGSAKYVQSQGPLGEAHREGEAAMMQAGLRHLISLRPTSFFSNFVAYDLPSLRDSASFASPLGMGPRVNWVSCEDIGRVAALLLLRGQGVAEAPTQDDQHGGSRYEVVDVTGPDEGGTLSAGDLQSVLTEAMGRPVRYEEVPLPDDPAYGQLWRFLRAGGFDASTPTVAQVTGRPPESLVDFIRRQSLV